jgi:para-nitrobenzyl esterase
MCGGYNIAGTWVKAGKYAGSNVTAVVTTSTGEVEGKFEGDVRVFQGIPFAQPPVGDLRFRSALPVTPWTNKLDATAPKAACMQPTDPTAFRPLIDEDCLYLNVWTPKEEPAAPLPVMVYIYGGGFTSGSGSEYNGTHTVGDNVILITINYRLGLFGFFPSKELAKENPDGANGGLTGITDQIVALKWIKANAAVFGGDPNSITVYGESAGGLSACILAISPQAAGLFDCSSAQSSCQDPAMDHGALQQRQEATLRPKRS